MVQYSTFLRVGAIRPAISLGFIRGDQVEHIFLIGHVGIDLRHVSDDDALRDGRLGGHLDGILTPGRISRREAVSFKFTR